MKAAHPAYEMQKFTKPAKSWFFYALTRWVAVVLALATAGFVLTGCDSAAAQAEEVEAQNSREWAGQQVCGPAATAVWRGDTLECLATRSVMAVE